MAIISWKLIRENGDSRIFPDWGIKSGTLRSVNGVAGSLALGFGAADLLGNLPFDPDETLLITGDSDAGDGVPIFRGRIIGENRGAYGSNESLILKLADPWWYLQQIIYQVQATVVDDWHSNPAPANPAGLQLSDFVTVQKTISEVIVSQDQAGTTVNTRDQILDVLNFAIAKGAPIAIGTIDPGDSMPRDLVQDVTCAEMLAKSLRWTPDQAAFWDYSVNPPALNIRTRANRTLLTLDIADLTTSYVHSEIEINPRRDLVRTGVRINYVRTHQRDSFEFMTVDQDDAGPDPTGIGALVVTLELFGSYLNNGFLVDEEPTPPGLAARLYAAYSILPFEGRILLVDDDVDPAVTYLGRTIRILNGAPDWATATMDVQQVSLDLFTGRTELSVGPATQLGPTDLVGLVRKGRTVAPTISDIIHSGPSTPPIPPVNGDPGLQFPPTKAPGVILGQVLIPDCADPSVTVGIRLDYVDIYDAPPVTDPITHTTTGGNFVATVNHSDLLTYISEGGTVLLHGILFGCGRSTRGACSSVILPTVLVNLGRVYQSAPTVIVPPPH